MMPLPDALRMVWRLEPPDRPSRATLQSIGSDAIRVERIGAAEGTWELRLVAELAAVAGPCRLSFDARSSGAESVGLVATRRSDPRQVWGRSTMLPVSDVWQPQCHEFQLEDDDDLQIIWGIGAGIGALELRSARLERLVRPPWIVDPATTARVRLLTTAVADPPLTVVRHAAGLPFHEVELRQMRQLEAGNYQVVFQCRGEPSAPFAVTLRSSSSADHAWSATNLVAEPEWAGHLFEFALPGAFAGEWVWALGGADGLFEMRGIECRRLERAPWHLDIAGSLAARMVACPEAPSGVRLELPAAPADRWDAQLQTRGRLPAGSHRLVCRARAMRPTTLAITALASDGPRCALFETWEFPVGPEWETVVREVTVPGDTDYELALALGTVTGWIDIAAWEWQPLERPPGETIARDPSALRLTALAGSANGVCVVRQASRWPRWDAVFRLSWPLAAGAYRARFRVRTPVAESFDFRIRRDNHQASEFAIQDFSCGPEGRELCVEFSVAQPTTIEWCWALGGSDTPLEIEQMACEILDPPSVDPLRRPGEDIFPESVRWTPLIEPPPRDTVTLEQQVCLSPGHYRLNCQLLATAPAVVVLHAQPQDREEPRTIPPRRRESIGAVARRVCYEVESSPSGQLLAHWVVGESGSGVVVDDVRWQRLSRPSLTLHQPDDSSIALEPLADVPQGLRVVAVEPCAGPWQAQLVGTWHLAAGQQGLVLRMRAAQPTWVHALWVAPDDESIAWSRRELLPAGQTVTWYHEFDLEQAGGRSLRLDVSQLAGAIELIEADCRPLGRPPFALHGPVGAELALHPLAENPLGTRVVVGTPAWVPWSALLEQPWHLAAGHHVFELRLADLPPSGLELLVVSRRRGTALWSHRAQSLPGQASAWRHEFTLDDPDELALLIDLGGLTGPLDVVAMTIRPLDRPPWVLHHPADAMLFLAPRREHSDQLVVRGDFSQTRAPWEALLEERWPLAEGDFAVDLGLRADPAAQVPVLLVSRSRGTVVWSQTLWTTATERSTRHEFHLDEPDEVALLIDLGGLTGPLEVVEFACRPLGRPPIVLHQPPAAALTLEPVSGAPQGLRVRIDAPPSEPWETLLEERWPLSAGTHALSLELASDEVTAVTLLVVPSGQGVPCGSRTVSLSAGCPERARFEFTLSESDEVALLIDLGAARRDVVLRGLATTPLARPPLVIHTAPTERGWLETPADSPSGARVVRIGEPVAAWDFQLTAPLGHRLGWWRLTYQARSDRSLTVPLIVSTVDGERPLAALALVNLSPEPPATVYEFALSEPGPTQVSWGLGELVGAADWLDLSLHALARRPWHLHEENLARARLVAPAEAPETGLRVEILETRGNPLDLLLCSARLAVRRGARYRLAFSARAERPRLVTLGLAQCGPPWERLGLRERLELDATWRPWFFEFTATADEPAAEFYFSLGHETSAVEFRDLEAEELP